MEISKEISRMEYRVRVQKEAMKELEKAKVAEINKVSKAEKQLERLSIILRNYVVNAGQRVAEATKLTEAESLKKKETLAEIEKAKTEIMSVKRDISKHKETLKEAKVFKMFLMSAAPSEWREERRSSQSKSVKASCLRPGAPETSESSDSDEEPALYFTNPKQMLDLLTGLEEKIQCYSLNLHETKEEVKEIHANTTLIQDKMNCENAATEAEIERLRNAIEKKHLEAAELKCRMFCNDKDEDIGKTNPGENKRQQEQSKKKTGKKLMPRSEPPKVKKQNKMHPFTG